MASNDLDCADDLKNAIAHIEAGTGKMGMTLLTKYQDCHETHKSCPFKGDACVLPELLEGFFQNQDKSADH